METQRCESCGSGISKEGTTLCTYCGSSIRSVNERLSRFDDSDERFTKAKQAMLDARYSDALLTLEQILTEEPTSYRAWYLKSVLPIITQATHEFEGHSIDINIVHHLNRKSAPELNSYLQKCGMNKATTKRFIRHYVKSDFLFTQQIMYLDCAIEFAPSERRAFFQLERETLTRNKNRMKRPSRIAKIAILVLTALGIASTTFAILWRFM